MITCIGWWIFINSFLTSLGDCILCIKSLIYWRLLYGFGKKSINAHLYLHKKSKQLIMCICKLCNRSNQSQLVLILLPIPTIRLMSNSTNRLVWKRSNRMKKVREKTRSSDTRQLLIQNYNFIKRTPVFLNLLSLNRRRSGGRGGSRGRRNWSFWCRCISTLASARGSGSLTAIS